MRIGIFTDSYKPYTSEVVTSIITFKEELVRQGHQVFILPSYPRIVSRKKMYIGFIRSHLPLTGILNSPYRCCQDLTCWSKG